MRLRILSFIIKNQSVIRVYSVLIIRKYYCIVYLEQEVKGFGFIKNNLNLNDRETNLVLKLLD